MNSPHIHQPYFKISNSLTLREICDKFRVFMFTYLTNNMSIKYVNKILVQEDDLFLDKVNKIGTRPAILIFFEFQISKTL